MAVFADADHAPLIDQDRRRDAEGHHVGEAVVFLAERTFGAGPARDAAIEAVEQHGDEDGAAGHREVAVDGGDQRVETRKQAPRGEQIGQQVDAASGVFAGVFAGVWGSFVTAGIIGESLT